MVITNLAIATAFITILVLWDLFGHLPVPPGVAGHEGSTMSAALNGMRLVTNRFLAGRGLLGTRAGTRHRRATLGVT